MQPLHKIYGLIAYLTCTIYSYNKIYFLSILQLIFIFIQELLGKKLLILNFVIYLYINSNDDPKPCKVESLFNLHEFEMFPNKSKLIMIILM
jgi:hypothetical protein